MYLWTLVGHNTSEATVDSGVGGDLSQIMRDIEPLLQERRGFVARITEVVPQMSVLHLGCVHVPTGREWDGRRDNRGGICWQEHFRRVDPDTVYQLETEWGAGTLAG